MTKNSKRDFTGIPVYLGQILSILKFGSRDYNPGIENRPGFPSRYGVDPWLLVFIVLEIELLDFGLYKYENFQTLFIKLLTSLSFFMNDVIS